MYLSSDDGCPDNVVCDGNDCDGLMGGARPIRSATSRWVSPSPHWTPNAASARFFKPNIYIPPFSGGSRYEYRY